jgi:hypothetical protein
MYNPAKVFSILAWYRLHRKVLRHLDFHQSECLKAIVPSLKYGVYPITAFTNTVWAE